MWDISTQEVCFAYGGKINILNNMSISIRKHSFSAVMGPNGCGKSTFIRNILNFYTPQKGSIEIRGINIKGMKPTEMAKIVSFIPQKSSLSADLTVRDLIMMGRVVHIKNKWIGFTRHDKEIADNLVEQLNLEKFADRSALSLSGGEFQRVLLARALAQEPEILLLDEPTSSLDMKYCMEIMAIVRELTVKKELTALAVLHDLNMTAMYCSDIFFMKDGSVRYHGTPRQVYTSEIIKDIYGIDALILKTEEGTPFIVPKTHPAIPAKKEKEMAYV
ncbi:MAG TPA: ABC transporter ATP-binding protein [Petrotogaceae bacterium]|jgi:iron complex transport system ATP-binding protein|nr:ABC transporter ATP-binding protein [Petrotogaceae bacterium]HOT32672.1 ABC transporter ATP-binding protein [Petrotogaceae bacterium]HPG48809.1 ABC transporter ATP-binding protein [Petrotogaceae bacterium]HQF33702.1 ABC transporter ATP-binding protein [Petrotogaceae bacterium]HQH33443.1 ABC transporter ATP-binding protein [Petrotogaceae bacterium]